MSVTRTVTNVRMVLLNASVTFVRRKRTLVEVQNITFVANWPFWKAELVHSDGWTRFSRRKVSVQTLVKCMHKVRGQEAVKVATCNASEAVSTKALKMHSCGFLYLPFQDT